MRRPDRGRLLPLTGPSGVGKTRLVLALAGTLAGVLADGVVFGDLAPIREAALVLSTLAQTLRLREQAEFALPEQGRVCVQDKQMLRVRDHFEQLLEAAPLVADFLARCPHRSVLVTGRTSLRAG